MHLRKIQKTGGTTYIVSLPKKWVKEASLSRGSIISINELKDGSLRLTPGVEEKPTRRSARISSTTNLRRSIMEKYLLGYDTVEIHSEDKLSERTKKKISDMLSFLLGYEIIEETASSLKIRNLLDPAEVRITKTLQRLYSVVSVMHKDLIQGIKNGDRALLKDVSARDHEANKLYFLLVRQIRKVIQEPYLREKEGIKSVDCVDYRLVAKILEDLGDFLDRLASTLSKSKNLKSFNPLLKHLEPSLDVHSLAKKALFTKDVKLAVRARDLYAEIPHVKLKRDETGMAIQTYLKNIAAAGRDLADIVIGE